MNKTKKIDVFAWLFKSTKYCRSRNARKTVPLANAAFTLIELIVVMAIIGVLVLLAAPKFIGYTREAKITQGTHDAKVIESSIDQHLFMHETMDEFLKNPTGTDALNAIAAQGALVSAKGLIDIVPVGEYFELSLSDIKNKLQVSMNSGNRVFVEKSGLVYVDIKSKGQTSNPDELDEPDVPDVPETDYYFEYSEEGVITNFYPSGKLETLETMTDVTIPESINGVEIVAIGNNAFNNKEISKISIPGTVKSIGEGAFQYNDLQEVIIHEGTSILDESFSFNGETKDSGTIETGSGPGLYMLVNKVWIKVTNPQWFIFDSNTNTITGYHNSLIIDGVTVQSPKNVVIPPFIDGVPVTKIGARAFQYKQLTSVEFHNEIVSIGISAFEYNKLTSLTLPNITEIKEYSFANNLISSIVIPNTVKLILNGSFRDNKIENLSIPNSVTSIYNGAFRNNSIKELNIPDNVTTIHDDAFAMNMITKVTIGSGVSHIGRAAFATTKTSNPKFVVSELNSYFKQSISGNGLYSKNEKVLYAGNESGEILSGVTKIVAYAFAYKNLTNISLPSTLTDIEEGAFVGNELSSLTIPNSVTHIRAEAFSKNNISSLNPLSNVTFIGWGAFYGNQLKEVTFSKSAVTFDEEYSFYYKLGEGEWPMGTFRENISPAEDPYQPYYTTEDLIFSGAGTYKNIYINAGANSYYEWQKQ